MQKKLIEVVCVETNTVQSNIIEDRVSPCFRAAETSIWNKLQVPVYS